MPADPAGPLAGFPVTINLPVLWGDQDAFRHVNNIVYLRWFESARIAYWTDVTGAEQIVTDLFRRYSDLHDPEAMPAAWIEIMKPLTPRAQARVAADYLAGQTDRYALDEHRRLFKATPELK